MPIHHFYVRTVVTQILCVPGAVSVSESVDEDALRAFVLAHPNMTFLGLMYLNACYDQMYVNPDHPHYRHDLVVSLTLCSYRTHIFVVYFYLSLLISYFSTYR